MMAAKIPALQRAEALYRRGAWAQAAEAYREVLRLAPEHVAARYNLGLLLLRRGDLSKGLAHLQHAAAEAADAGCPFSALIRATATVSVEAVLEGGGS